MIKEFKKLMVRAFPGLSGFHSIQYAKVVVVYEETGVHKKTSPVFCADIQRLDHKFNFIGDPIKRVPYSSPFKQIKTNLKKDDLVLLEFPYWVGQPLIRGVIFIGESRDLEEGEFRVESPIVSLKSQEVRLVDNAENSAVNYEKLKPVIEDIYQKLNDLASSVCVPSSALNSVLSTEIVDKIVLKEWEGAKQEKVRL